MSTAADSMASRSSSTVSVNGTLEERLSSLLSSPSQFSVAAYLNLALKEAASSHDSDELQRRMAELALQLQLQTQSCHEDIGRIGAELQAIMPRCAADVGRIGVGLEGMRIDAASLLSSNTGNDQEVSTSMETLSTLHALRSNLTRTKDILTAAASWDTTLASIAPLMAQQNLSEAVEALVKLESGERALRGIKGKAEREESIAKIRQQVQVMLQPQLRHALQNMHSRLSPLQQCVSLYTALGKMDSLKEEYVKNRPGAVHKAWFSYTPPKPAFDSKESGYDDPEADPATAFVTWLPSWYDAVLSLLTEERRQSLAVFGPDLAPEMITKVLGECFRPILSSFRSRLESLYSPRADQGLSSLGSLESICSIYEATLQFLALAYETVAGSWLDVSEASSSSAADTSRAALSLYSDVMAVFLQVASPFSVYQEKFAELERIHSGVATGLVAKDIEQAVSSVSASTASLEGLQDATERLKGLSPFIFPLAEGGLVRFELLNGGYRAKEALSTTDEVLSGHAGELSMAILTLSTSTKTDQNRLADSFDEQHVHCALEVLKIAGSFRRDLRIFEYKTRERLGVLSERMAAHIAHEKELQEASSGAGSSGSSFVLPDSMTMVEIDSLLTKTVCGDVSDDDETGGSFAVLQRLATSNQERSSATTLFPEAEESTNRLASSCHTFVFDVCFTVPEKQLRDMSSMAAWRESASVDDFESYGTLPQQYITHVGENMLALVQALEPFASDPEALALASEVMTGLRDVALQPWREFVSAAGSADASTDRVIESLMDGKELLDFVICDKGFDDEEEEEEAEEDESAKAITAFCNAWLDVVGLAVTGRLLQRIMRIQHLTQKGCEHLAADLTYLMNVFSALGISGHPHPLLSHFAELAMMEKEALRQQISSRDKNHAVEAVIHAAEVRLALMRGIAETNNF